MPARPYRAGVLLISDNHAGHTHAPTPPGDYRGDPDSERGRVQAAIWEAYLGCLRRAQAWCREMTGAAPRRCLHLGDCIEGKGERSGSTELLEADRIKQAHAIAAPVLLASGCEDYAIVYGTPYHSGVTEDFEDEVVFALRAAGATARIASQMHIDLGGLVVHAKHHVGGSSIPHGVHTASAREREMHLLWERDAGWPAARLSLRGHTHRYHYEGTAQTTSIVLPALLPPSTKYGGRRCFAPVDFGVTALVHGGPQGYDWRVFLATFEQLRPETIDWSRAEKVSHRHGRGGVHAGRD